MCLALGRLRSHAVSVYSGPGEKVSGPKSDHRAGKAGPTRCCRHPTASRCWTAALVESVRNLSSGQVLKLIAVAVLAELQHCSFRPATNCGPGAKRVSSEKRLHELATPVHDRRERAKERSDREKLALERSECPFTPNLEKPNVKGLSPPIAASPPARAGAAAALDPPPDPKVVGVGLVLKTEHGGRFPVVKTIQPEGAAAEHNRSTQSDAFIRVEDQVLEVAGLSCADKKPGELADVLSGPVASTVVMTFGASSAGKA
jgi:hypothetical protein